MAIFIALKWGSVHFSNRQLFEYLFHPQDNLHSVILHQLRLPRVLSAFVTGALLALAGVLMQALLSNPLADPYIFGVSGGAAVFTLLGITLGITGAWLTVQTLLGALLAISLVFLLARPAGLWAPVRLLLTGVILASGWSAIISFILALSPNPTLHTLLFWLMGDLSSTHMPYLGFIVLVVGFFISMSFSPELNMVLRGHLQAQSLGVNVKKINISIYFLSALLTATAVSIGGTIGFIGLVIPHMLRLIIGSDHRWLIPSCILLGGSLLTLADTLARVIIAPQQLPVGIFTAFIGVPMFLYLLNKAG
jgi:iron complex transport system permease protein